MKKDNTLKDEKKKEKNILDLIIRIVLALVAIIIVVVIYNTFFNDSVYIDLNDAALVETDDGYKKSVDFETTVDKKEVLKEKNGKKYIIICYDGDDKYEIEVGNYVYTKLDIDEKIKVYGTAYYNKKGLLLSYDYQVESLVKEDDNGIIDIPDGYKEPESGRVPGVDYGDGVTW